MKNKTKDKIFFKRTFLVLSCVDGKCYELCLTVKKYDKLVPFSYNIR